MAEKLPNDPKKQILDWASHQLFRGEFSVVLSGETPNFAVNLLTQLRDIFMSGKGRLRSSGAPNEIFLEFVTTKDLDRQNICMFAMLKQAGFQKEDIRNYFLNELFPQYREKLRFSTEQIDGLANSVNKALGEVFPTIN